jgi:hypothetical protein
MVEWNYYEVIGQAKQPVTKTVKGGVMGSIF